MKSTPKPFCIHEVKRENSLMPESPRSQGPNGKSSGPDASQRHGAPLEAQFDAEEDTIVFRRIATNSEGSLCSRNPP
jgi:hypothetical protein